MYKNTQNMIAVMQAFCLGHEIQMSLLGKDIWTPIVSPSWNWGDYDYRVKPGTQVLFWAVLQKNDGILITTNPKTFNEYQQVLIGYSDTAKVIKEYSDNFVI